MAARKNQMLKGKRKVSNAYYFYDYYLLLCFFQIQMVKMLIVVVAVFTMCYLPFHLMWVSDPLIDWGWGFKGQLWTSGIFYSSLLLNWSFVLGCHTYKPNKYTHVSYYYFLAGQSPLYKSCHRSVQRTENTYDLKCANV